MPRRAARIDGNHADIVDALRCAGAAVQSLAAVGQGVADLLVCFDGVLYLLECKDGSKPPSKRRLTPDQKDWAKAWPVAVVLSPEDALRAIGAMQ